MQIYDVVNKFVYFCKVTNELEILKGLHPGLVLERKLQEKHLKKGLFALSIREYPQTLTSITKGKRDMNTALALKLEKALGLEEGYFMILQVYYDIRQEKKKQSQPTPDMNKLRLTLFWDTDPRSLDWERQYKAIIRRVLERGNEEEIAEITRFYGEAKVKAVQASLSTQ